MHPQRRFIVPTAATTVAVCVSSALLLTGCGGVNDAAPEASARPSAASAAPAAVTLAQARAIASDYDLRNNAAIDRASQPPYDENAWATADSEVALAGDIYSTRYKRSAGTHDAAPFTTRVVSAFGSTTAYGDDGQSPAVWLATHTTSVGTGTSPSGGASATDDIGSLRLMVPTQAAGRITGWRLAASIGGVRLSALPRPNPAPTVLTKTQRQTAANAVPAVISAIRTGDTAEFADAGPLTDYRDGVGSSGQKGMNISSACRPWGSPVDTDPATAVVVGTPALRLVRAGTVTLGFLTLDCAVTATSKTDGQVALSKDSAAAEGDDGRPKSQIDRRTGVTVLLSIPDSGRPTVLAGDASYLVPVRR